MKRLIFIVLLLGAAYIAHEQTQPQWQPATAEIQTGQRSSGFRDGDQVRGSGTVIRILPDDTDGSRHQRFIVRLASGRSLLIAHNIDLAPRIPSLQVGDSVSFYGEYAWNNKGGVVHWALDRASRVDSNIICSAVSLWNRRKKPEAATGCDFSDDACLYDVRNAHLFGS